MLSISIRIIQFINIQVYNRIFNLVFSPLPFKLFNCDVLTGKVKESRLDLFIKNISINAPYFPFYFSNIST